jgi:hypothetical protein
MPYADMQARLANTLLMRQLQERQRQVQMEEQQRLFEEDRYAQRQQQGMQAMGQALDMTTKAEQAQHERFVGEAEGTGYLAGMQGEQRLDEYANPQIEAAATKGFTAGEIAKGKADLARQQAEAEFNLDEQKRQDLQAHRGAEREQRGDLAVFNADEALKRARVMAAGQGRALTARESTARRSEYNTLMRDLRAEIKQRQAPWIKRIDAAMDIPGPQGQSEAAELVRQMHEDSRALYEKGAEIEQLYPEFAATPKRTPSPPPPPGQRPPAPETYPPVEPSPYDEDLVVGPGGEFIPVQSAPQAPQGEDWFQELAPPPQFNTIEEMERALQAPTGQGSMLPTPEEGAFYREKYRNMFR